MTMCPDAVTFSLLDNGKRPDRPIPTSAEPHWYRPGSRPNVLQLEQSAVRERAMKAKLPLDC